MAVICYVGGSMLKWYLDIGESVVYAIARSCGSILKIVLMPAIIPPISRVIYTEVRNSEVGKFLGLDRRIADHKLFAIAASVMAIIHMIAHYLYNPDNFSKQPGITGVIMLLSLALPLAGVFLSRWCIPAINKLSYSTQILRPHQLGATVFVLAYAYHTTDGRLIWYAVGMYGVYVMDRIFERLWYRYQTKIKKAVKIDGTDFIMLSIDRPDWLIDVLPGQFCMLSFPEIDADLECAHPFTVVSRRLDELVFLIQKTGTWTTKLFDLINDEQTGKGLKIVVVGPFGSTLNSFYRHDKMAFIGTGIGITPFISFLEYSFNEWKKIPLVDMHISQREFANFVPCIQTLENTNDINMNRLNVHFHFTGDVDINELDKQIKKYSTDKVKLVLNVGTERHVNMKVAKFENKGVIVVLVHLNRPDINNVIRRADAVAVCGSHEVTNIVERVAIDSAKRCYKETY
jgi:predicted ferric reductase